MEYDLFRNKVQQVKAKKPILFALETDTPPSNIQDGFAREIYIRWTIVAIIS